MYDAIDPVRIAAGDGAGQAPLIGLTHLSARTTGVFIRSGDCGQLLLLGSIRNYERDDRPVCHVGMLPGGDGLVAQRATGTRSSSLK